MNVQRVKKYPSNPWGPFADDPWSLDTVTGPAWNRAVEKARELRLAIRRADDSLERLQKEWAEQHASAPGESP
jgi:hypothetical protein